MARNENLFQARRRLARIESRIAEVNAKFDPSLPQATRLDKLEEIGFLSYERAVALEDIDRAKLEKPLLVRIYRALKI